MEYSENQKNLRFGVTILAYVLVAALFFGIGYASGRRNGKIELTKELEDAAANDASGEDIAAAAVTEAEDTVYRVKIAGGRLYIYKIDSDTITVEAECAISEGVYPAEDIAELKHGIDFRDKNDAQAMFENFSS